MSDEEITGREVLDGEWVTGWEAVETVTEALARYGVSTSMSAGEILARMAVTGLLPTISDDRTHTQPISDDPETRPATERTKPRDEGWSLVSLKQWAATFGVCLFEGKHVQHAQCDFKLSAMTVVVTNEFLPPNAMLHEVASDPGFYMMMSRNILFYRDGLYAAARFAKGHFQDDDLYDYKQLDLSRLNLPGETPLETLERTRLAYRARHEGDGADVGARAKGRPGGKNGEPIATLTIKLMTIPGEQFNRYTADSAGAELQQLFEMSGYPVRGADNCKKDAAGVLRAVRAARGVE